MSSANMPIYQVKITLKDIDPPIWRRVRVSSDLTLAKFHKIIQAAMGWTDSHLHMFTVGIVRFTYPYEPGDLVETTAIDERKVELCHLVPIQRPFHGAFGFEMEYEYDYGDSWKHQLLFEDVLPPDPLQKTPVCTGGARHCPPEDVGGTWGYENFLEALRDPEHEEHEEYLVWAGGAFDPEAFDIDAVNALLRRLK